MDQRFNRFARLVGGDAVNALQRAHVAVFGLGGVGSWAVEALARSGVGHLTLVDADTVAISNINRQLPALQSTVGKPKTEIMRARVVDINPECQVDIFSQRFESAKAADWDMQKYDFVIDAIDSLADKAALILRCTAKVETCGFVSSMGAARRINPLKVTSGRFDKVQGDALAAALRRYFRRHQLFPQRKFTCIYSTEQPLPNRMPDEEFAGAEVDGMTYGKVSVNGAACTVTGAFGLALAATAINGILGLREH